MRMHLICCLSKPLCQQVLAPPHSLHLLLSDCANIGPTSGFLANGRFLPALPLGLVYVWRPPALCHFAAFSILLIPSPPAV